MPPVGIRIHNLNRRAAADLRLRPRGHMDRLPITGYYTKKYHAVAQLVEALRYKPEGRGFDS